MHVQVMCNYTNYGLEKCRTEYGEYKRTTGFVNKVETFINFSAEEETVWSDYKNSHLNLGLLF